MVVMVGGSFTGVTVRVNVLLAVKEPSLTVIVTILEPDAFAAGVNVAERPGPVPVKAILAKGRTVVSEDVAERVKLVTGVSMSPIVNGTLVGVSSGVDRFPMLVIVGGSSTLVTVKLKVLLAVNEPSLTVIVTVHNPKALAAGVNVAVRLVPVPLKTILPAGRIVPSDELAESVKFPIGVSTSPIVNDTDV